MPETFTWSPQSGFTGEDTPDVTVVKLGDRYEQRQVNGINPLMGKYPLTFIGYDDSKCSRPNVAKEVRAFLVARMAVESFYWTPPDTGVQALYVCRSWSMQKNKGVYTLTGTFEQVPR